MQKTQQRLSGPAQKQWNIRTELSDKSPVIEGRQRSRLRAASERAGFVAVYLGAANPGEAATGANPSALTFVLGSGRTVELPRLMDAAEVVKLLVWMERVLESSGASTRIYLAPGEFDMRTGLHGMLALVCNHLSCHPRNLLRDAQSGYAFVFSNAQRDQLKVLYFDRIGIRVCSKRLENERLRWPDSGAMREKFVLTHAECGALLRGIDLTLSRCQRWQQIAAREASAEGRNRVLAMA